MADTGTYIQVTDEVRRNVVNEGYLHSATSNFENIVAVGYRFSQFYFNDEKREAVNKLLDEIIQRMRATENGFFALFNIQGKNIAEKAYNFNKLLEKSMIDFEAFQRLSDPKLYTFLDKRYEEKIDLIIRNFEKWCEKNNSEVTKKISKDADLTTKLSRIWEAINSRYYLEITTGEKNKTPVQLRKKAPASLSVATKTFRVRLNTLSEALEKQLGIVNTQTETDLLEQIIQYVKPNADLEKLIRESYNEIKGKVDFLATNKSNLIGAIGELNIKILLDMLASKMADKTLKSFYVGDLYRAASGKDRKQSPIDFLIGKYGIQVKNTESDLLNKKFHNVKVVSDVTLDTFIKKTLGNSAAASMANQFRYLVINVSWLRYHGLSKDGEDDRLQLSDIPEVLQFINGILAQAGEAIFHTEAQKVFKGEKEIARNVRNVIFLLQSRYVVPISLMMEGVKQAWNSYDQKTSSGIGYFKNNELSVNDKMGTVSTKGAKGEIKRKVNLNAVVNLGAEEIQRVKKEEKLIGLPDNQLTYSGELLSYGSDLGQQFASGTTININYTFMMENLNNIYNYLRIW